jgi:hypothetical protein
MSETTLDAVALRGMDLRRRPTGARVKPLCAALAVTGPLGLIRWINSRVPGHLVHGAMNLVPVLGSPMS